MAQCPWCGLVNFRVRYERLTVMANGEATSTLIAVVCYDGNKPISVDAETSSIERKLDTLVAQVNRLPTA